MRVIIPAEMRKAKFRKGNLKTKRAGQKGGLKSRKRRRR